MKVEVEAFVLTREPGGHRMLRCSGGWNGQTTRAFLEETFNWLELRGGDAHGFTIPQLGVKAKQLTQLLLYASGPVHGLEQFSAVPELDVCWVPKNGIDLQLFTNLKRLRVEWEKRISEQVPRLTSLVSLGAMAYPGHDCTLFRPLHNLKNFSLTQGRAHNLAGLEAPQLEELHLAYLRGFEDLQSLMSFRKLKSLSLTNLPKLSGRLALSSCSELESLYVADSSITVDLAFVAGATELKKLWLAVPSTAPDWDALFSKRQLEFVGLLETDAPHDDETLKRAAEKHGHSILELRHVGPKKRRQVQIRLKQNETAT